MIYSYFLEFLNIVNGDHDLNGYVAFWFSNIFIFFFVFLIFKFMLPQKVFFSSILVSLILLAVLIAIQCQASFIGGV